MFTHDIARGAAVVQEGGGTRGTDVAVVGERALIQETAAAYVIHEAITRGVTLASAESCTGGLVAAALTDIPGSSDAFLGAVVSYANEVKHAVLGVPTATLATVGAVSEETARAMAEGVRMRLGADIAVSTTGIAGPGGGSAEKPVGTVWLALSTPLGTQAVCAHFEGDRRAVRQAAVDEALSLLGRGLQDFPAPSAS